MDLPDIIVLDYGELLMYSKKYNYSTEVDVYVCVHKWTVSNPHVSKTTDCVCVCSERFSRKHMQKN